MTSLCIFFFSVFLAHSPVFWVPAVAALAWSKALYIGKQTTWLKRGITCKASSYCTCSPVWHLKYQTWFRECIMPHLVEVSAAFLVLIQTAFMCLLVLDLFLKYLRASCKFKLLWLMEMPMLVNLKCIKHKSGYDSSFHNFSLNSAWCLEYIY